MRTIYLIGPREPSGLSWLYNCLLCLDIKVHYVNPRNDGSMWLCTENGCVLNPVDDIQKKWAPILSKKGKFNFRDDIQVQFDHAWPTGWQRNQKIIFFVRNPYDSLFSRWKRDANEMSFEDFLNVPDHITLLDKVNNWNLFCESWLAQRNCVDWHLVRFEDYKKNAKLVLIEVVKFLGINVSHEQLAYALSQSGFEEAKQVEQSYTPYVPDWLRVCDDVFHAYGSRQINRSGSGNEELSTGIIDRDYVVNRTGAVCSEFGYSAKVNYQIPVNYLPQKAMISFFNQLDMPNKWFADCSDFDQNKYFSEIENLFIYIRDVQFLLDSAARAGLIFGEIAAFFAALQEMQGNYLKTAKQLDTLIDMIESPQEKGNAKSILPLFAQLFRRARGLSMFVRKYDASD